MLNDRVFVFLANMKEFENSDSFQLYKLIRKLRLSLNIHRNNFRTLMKSIAEGYEKSQVPEFWRPPRKMWRHQSMMTTNLLNYLGSKEVIRNITNVFMNKHFNEANRDHIKAYSDKYLKPNAEYNTINRLRTYLVHYSIPDVGIKIGFRKGTGKFSSIYLHKAQLTRWDKWTAIEKAYLEALPDDLEIKEPVKSFHVLFMETQDRIFLELVDKYRSQLETLPSIMRTLFLEASSINYSESLPFKESWMRYLEYLLTKSKVKRLESKEE